MIVAVGVAVAQFLGGFAVPMPKEGKEVDEERPLLVGAEEPVLSLKDVLGSNDKIVRRGCKSSAYIGMCQADEFVVTIVIVTQLAQQLCGVSPGMSKYIPTGAVTHAP